MAFIILSFVSALFPRNIDNLFANVTMRPDIMVSPVTEHKNQADYGDIDTARVTQAQTLWRGEEGNAGNDGGAGPRFPPTLSSSSLLQTDDILLTVIVMSWAQELNFFGFLCILNVNYS